MFRLGLIGIVPIVTGIMRWCPANRILGLELEQKEQ
jgi:hypothetical protein